MKLVYWGLPGALSKMIHPQEVLVDDASDELGLIRRDLDSVVVLRLDVHNGI